MLQFNVLSPGSFRLTGGDRPIVAFPANGAKAAAEGTIVLLGVPEEQSTKGVVSWPGEYNVAGISIRGIGQDEGQQTSFVLEIDGVRLGLLSSPLKDWTDKQIESAPEIDVLIIPAEDAKLVQKLVDEFDPRVLLLLPGKDSASVEKAVGVKEHVAEYKIKGSLPAEGREAYVLAA
jgi:hypothetical protein